MPYVDRDGVQLYSEARGSGSAVLLTHGYSATLRMWDPQMEALTDRHRLIAWDMRGHGRSDSPADPAAYSQAATIADMATVLDACDVDAAVVAGLSLGGFLSLLFHLAHRERVLALMLLDTGPGYKKDEARAGWNRFAEKAACAYEEKGLTALGKGSEVRAGEHRSAEGLANAARGILTQHDAQVMESLPGIEVPVLVLAGGDDKPFLGSTDYMAAKIPGATRVIIDGAGHAPNLEKPDEFNAAVASFLAGL